MGCECRAAAVDFRVPRFFNYKNGRCQQLTEALLTQVNHGSTTPNKTAQIAIDSSLSEMRKGRSSTCPLQNVQQKAGIAGWLGPIDGREHLVNSSRSGSSAS
jgi:hypothetical protein